MVPSFHFAAALSLSTDAPFVDVSARALPSVATMSGSPAEDWILDVNAGGGLLGDLDLEGKIDCVIVDGSTLECVAKNEH